ARLAAGEGGPFLALWDGGPGGRALRRREVDRDDGPARAGGPGGLPVLRVRPGGGLRRLRGGRGAGGPSIPPSPDEVLQLLRQPRQNVVVNLLRVPLADRPRFCAGLLLPLQELRVQPGRPHWLVFDEAPHLFPADWDSAEVSLPQQLET